MNALSIIKKLDQPSSENVNQSLNDELNALVSGCYINMSDDFNTAKTLAVLFEMSSRINDMKSGNINIKQIDKATFKDSVGTVVRGNQRIH